MLPVFSGRHTVHDKLIKYRPTKCSLRLTKSTILSCEYKKWVVLLIIVNLYTVHVLFFCFLFLKTKISNFFMNDKVKQTKKIYRNTFYSIPPFPHTTLCTCKCNAESWKKVNKRSSLKKDESAFKVVYLLISLLNVRPYEGICICPQKLYIKGGLL